VQLLVKPQNRNGKNGSYLLITGTARELGTGIPNREKDEGM
jgi:hypothetical protein